MMSPRTRRQVSPTVRNKKMGKNQAVDTSFLRMNSRDADEAAASKEKAMREFLVRQEAAKDERFSVGYIYRSEVTQREIPTGVHRGTVELKRGLTAEEARAVPRCAPAHPPPPPGVTAGAASGSQVCKLVREDVHLLGGPHAIPTVAGIRQERDLMLVANCTHLESSVASFLIPVSCTMFELCTKKWCARPQRKPRSASRPCASPVRKPPTHGPSRPAALRPCLRACLRAALRTRSPYPRPRARAGPRATRCSTTT